LSICFLLLITVWVTPENQLAELALRGSSVLAQDFRGPQIGFSLRQSRTAQFACISRLTCIDSQLWDYGPFKAYRRRWTSYIRIQLMNTSSVTGRSRRPKVFFACFCARPQNLTQMHQIFVLNDSSLATVALTQGMERNKFVPRSSNLIFNLGMSRHPMK